MTTKMKIVAIGECMVEMSCQPETENWRLGFAGDTFNTAYYMKARLGGEANVEYVTCVGDDLYSKQMLKFIAQNDIGTGYIRQIAGKRPGLYLIHQEAGDRQFTYWRETSAARHLAEDPDLLRQALKGASLVYFSGITLAILNEEDRAVFLDIIARTQAKLICFDPNIRPNLWPDHQQLRQVLQQTAALCDIVLPTHSDEAYLFGDETPEQMAIRYLSYGAGEVVVKNGAVGALACNAQQQVECASIQVDDVVDATGAGDSFNAAFLAARFQAQDLFTSLQAGHGVAAQVIRASGALIDKDVISWH